MTFPLFLIDNISSLDFPEISIDHLVDPTSGLFINNPNFLLSLSETVLGPHFFPFRNKHWGIRHP